MNQLEVSHLNKAFGNVSVLKDVCFKAKKGEFVVLVGPSGCGKTTLLRMIAGLESVDQGSLKIQDRQVSQLPPAKRNLAMVFQDYALYPHLSVRENLAFGLKNQGLPKQEIETRIGTTSSMLQIEKLLNRRPSELSGGQRQRVAIGRAIVKKPSLFLFDEPLSNLDAQLRCETRVELANLHKKLGSTSIYVTHDQVEAMTLADKIVILNKGVVQQIGTPLEVYHRPKNKFVASFIGSPKMNFLEGHVREQSSQTFFYFGDKRLHIPSTPKVPGKYTLGIRPEGIQLQPHSALSRGWTCSLEVEEPHGFETHFIVKLQNQNITVRCGEKEAETLLESSKGSHKLSMQIDASSALWFDSNGECLSYNHPPMVH